MSLHSYLLTLSDNFLEGECLFMYVRHGFNSCTLEGGIMYLDPTEAARRCAALTQQLTAAELSVLEEMSNKLELIGISPGTYRRGQGEKDLNRFKLVAKAESWCLERHLLRATNKFVEFLQQSELGFLQMPTYPVIETRECSKHGRARFLCSTQVGTRQAAYCIQCSNI